jgi:hypothetical protein
VRHTPAEAGTKQVVSHQDLPSEHRPVIQDRTKGKEEMSTFIRRPGESLSAFSVRKDNGWDTDSVTSTPAEQPAPPPPPEPARPLFVDTTEEYDEDKDE